MGYGGTGLSTKPNSDDIRVAVDIRFDEWIETSNLIHDMFRMYSCKMDDDQVKFLLKHAFVEGMLFGTQYMNKVRDNF